MKKFLMFGLSALIAMPLVGCRAEGDIDVDDHGDAKSVKTERKTTYDRDGDKTVKTTKTERKIDN